MILFVVLMELKVEKVRGSDVMGIKFNYSKAFSIMESFRTDFFDFNFGSVKICFCFYR